MTGGVMENFFLWWPMVYIANSRILLFYFTVVLVGSYGCIMINKHGVSIVDNNINGIFHEIKH